MGFGYPFCLAHLWPHPCSRPKWQRTEKEPRQWKCCPTLSGPHFHHWRERCPSLEFWFLLGPGPVFVAVIMGMSKEHGGNEPREGKEGKSIFHTVSSIRSPFSLLLKFGVEGFFWSTLCTPRALYGVSGCTVFSHGDVQREKNNKLTILVAFQILVFFPKLPGTNYFSESSDSCSMHSAHIWQLNSMGDVA